MKNNKWFLITTLLLIVALVSACGSNDTSSAPTNTNNSGNESNSGDSQEQFSLKFGEINPDGHPITEGAYEFARLVEEKSEGRIKVEIYSSGTLGSEREHIQSLQMGGLDFFRANSNVLPDYGADRMAILSLPFIFNDRDHMWKVLNSPIGEEILQDLEDEDLGIIGLTYYDDGARHIFASRKIESVEDLKGMKIRVPENEILMDMIEAFNASPTPISYGELYSALQTAIVDGAENTIAGYLSNSFYEVSPFLTLNSHMSSPGVVVVSKLTWDKFSDEDKQIIKEAAQESSVFVREETEKYEENALEELAGKGATITYLDDLSPWQEAVVPLYDKYGKDYEEVINAIKEIE